MKLKNMKSPQPIPYQGSKRVLAPLILKYFPAHVHRLIEPFAGSAAISVAAAMRAKADYFLINDINAVLIHLLNKIVHHPEKIADEYEALWNAQLGNEKAFYLDARNRFNKNQRSDYFLYIMARCIKGAIRYNNNGEFNQSADNRRKGKKPLTMRREIALISKLLKGKSTFFAQDYFEMFKLANTDDLIYMDPPYQGTSSNRDTRYLSGLDFDVFVKNLHYLNEKNISYLISYDGKTGKKTYGTDLPKSLKLHKIMIEVGRSSQATLLGQKDITYEALYISKALADKLPMDLPENVALKPKQLQLL